jgi:hypothetical protein
VTGDDVTCFSVSKVRFLGFLVTINLLDIFCVYITDFSSIEGNIYTSAEASEL